MPADLTPIEALDRRILDLCTGINAATYELLAKVRELTRLANRENEERLVEFALRYTAVTVAERCRELRCGSEDSLDVAARAWANRSLRIRRDHQRNMMVVTVELPMDTGELVEKALDKARDDELLEIPDLADTSWSTWQADAFVNLVTGYLSGEHGTSADNHLVTIHVDQSALAGNGGETSIDNLLLLCTKHHTLVHEGGFSIDKDFQDNWCFKRPDGIGVPAVGYVSGLYENPPAGGLLSVAENSTREPPAPVYLH